MDGKEDPGDRGIAAGAEDADEKRQEHTPPPPRRMDTEQTIFEDVSQQPTLQQEATLYEKDMAIGADLEESSSTDNQANDSDEDFKKIYVPDENDELIDPRLKDYPILLVAKTVDLHNDFSEPILTFRFWFLTTFWVIAGCAVSSLYYFKPYSQSISSYCVQLLSWGMGYWMAKYLPNREFNLLGWKFNLNPGPWNAKEHSLIIVAYWGSCYTAYGMGPLSAMELFYGKKIDPIWGILFLLTTQMLGYGFCGLFRDILVRPPKIYYPGVLPNVALFNAMHKNPSVSKHSLKFFAVVSSIVFVYQWLPQFFMPLLSSIPLLCYMTRGQWKGFIMGSGMTGFGMLDLSLDWNYASFFGPMYTPLWAQMAGIGGCFFVTWFLYPIMYFGNVLDAQTYPPMSSGTFDETGNHYHVTNVLNDDYTLNQTAYDAYGPPRWAPAYAMNFFWGFAASAAALTYAGLFYGPSSYRAIRDAFKGKYDDYGDPYLILMSKCPRVPHWWYLTLLLVMAALSLGTIYGADLGFPWWGFILICSVSTIMTFPNGVLFGVANNQVSLSYLSELIAGFLFPGKPFAVLTSMTYGRQILEQNLNLISDYKFGFYMKIPEKEMFIGQIYGTLLGPFVNYGVMRVVIDVIGKERLTGNIESNQWYAVASKNYYALSVVWGVLGPKEFFSSTSPYSFMYWSFIVGPTLVVVAYLLHRWRPKMSWETLFNPTVILYGCTTFPTTPQTANLMTSAALCFFFMGYMLRYHPAWFRKYNYLLGVGLDCGTQVCATVIMLGLNLSNTSFPYWWGNDPSFPEKCYPPADIPVNALN